MGKDVTWGFLGHLTPEQTKMLEELRRRVDAELPKKPYLEKDSSLLRYCRARDFNLHKTFTMIKEDVAWREPFEGYVFIRSRDFGSAYVMHEEGALRLAGKTKDGRLLLMSQVRFFWPKLVTDPIQIVYLFVFYVDRIVKEAEEIGQETFVIIIDLEGFTMANFSLSLIKIGLSCLQEHYPERLGRAYVVNAPFIFTAAWRVIEPLLDARTRAKVAILGSNMEAIKEDVDPSVLEQPYGGTHERHSVPDHIMQIAIDNEKFLRAELEGQAATAEEAAAAEMGSGTSSRPTSSATASGSAAAPARAAGAEPPSPATSGTSLPVGATKPRAGMRRRVRAALKQMLFSTEKRAVAVSLGEDPNKLDDAPHRLVTKSPSRKPSSSGGARGGGGGVTASARRLFANASRIATTADADDIEIQSDADADGESTDKDLDLIEVKIAHDKLLGKVQDVEERLNEVTHRLQLQIHALLAVLVGIIAWIASAQAWVPKAP